MTAHQGPCVELHELCSMFPPVEGEDFETLVADIKQNGLRDAIVTYEGKILDGQNRCAACAAAGVVPRFECLPENVDPVSFVVSRNLRRRHLTASQLAMIAAEIQGHRERAQARQVSSRARPGERVDERNVALAQSGGKASAAAAMEVGVSPRLVEHAIRVNAQGIPALTRVALSRDQIKRAT